MIGILTLQQIWQNCSSYFHATPKRVIRFPTPGENAKIVAGAKADPHALLLTEAQLKAMVPMRTLRGRPKLDHKKLIFSVR